MRLLYLLKDIYLGLCQLYNVMIKILRYVMIDKNRS